jgi:hypothetical protein
MVNIQRVMAGLERMLRATDVEFLRRVDLLFCDHGVLMTQPCVICKDVRKQTPRPPHVGLGPFYELSPSPRKPADKIAEHLAFSNQQYVGRPIHRCIPSKPYDEQNMRGLGDLSVGTIIRVFSLGGFAKAEIIAVKDATAIAVGEHTLWYLEFDKDDRHCWVSAAAVSKAAINSIEVRE